MEKILYLHVIISSRAGGKVLEKDVRNMLDLASEDKTSQVKRRAAHKAGTVQR